MFNRKGMMGMHASRASEELEKNRTLIQSSLPEELEIDTVMGELHHTLHSTDPKHPRAVLALMATLINSSVYVEMLMQWLNDEHNITPQTAADGVIEMVRRDMTDIRHKGVRQS